MRPLTLKIITATSFLIAAAACGEDESSPEATVQISTNELGNFDADFTGDAGSASESFTWENAGGNQVLAEYSMDITATSGGQVDVVVLDAEGAEVGAFSLEAGKGDDSLDGMTSSGASGEWTINIDLVDFAGDGSLNLDGGNPDEI